MSSRLLCLPLREGTVFGASRRLFGLELERAKKGFDDGGTADQSSQNAATEHHPAFPVRGLDGDTRAMGRSADLHAGGVRGGGRFADMVGMRLHGRRRRVVRHDFHLFACCRVAPWSGGNVNSPRVACDRVPTRSARAHLSRLAEESTGRPELTDRPRRSLRLAGDALRLDHGGLLLVPVVAFIGVGRGAPSTTSWWSSTAVGGDHRDRSALHTLARRDLKPENLSQAAARRAA